MGGGITLNHFLVLSLIVFSLGLFTVLTRRNAIGILMGVELILNSANINYLAFAFYGGGKYDGQIFAIFVIMLAAAEAVIGLAVVLAIYQNFKTIDVDATETAAWIARAESNTPDGSISGYAGYVIIRYVSSLICCR